MDQVKVELEQWTEMQAMLEQVRQEMLELQSSRDLWQRRAIASDVNVRSLHAQVCTESPIGSLGKASSCPRYLFILLLFFLRTKKKLQVNPSYSLDLLQNVLQPELIMYSHM